MSQPKVPEPRRILSRGTIAMGLMLALLMATACYLWSTGRYDARVQANRYLDCFERQDAECIAEMVTEQELKDWKTDRKIVAAFVRRFLLSASEISRKDCRFRQESWTGAGVIIPYRTRGGNWTWHGVAFSLDPSGFQSENLLTQLFYASMWVNSSDRYFGLKTDEVHRFNAEVYDDFFTEALPDVEALGLTWYFDPFGGKITMRAFAAQCAKAAPASRRRNRARGIQY